MRELKFRAWDKKQKKMLYGVSIGTIKVWDENAHLLSKEFSYSEDCVFEQYTWLKDKNGREIYEGDIVEIDKYGKFQIIWYEWACRFDFDKIGKREREEPLLSQDWEQKTEVIGNIHENPELLKEEE